MQSQRDVGNAKSVKDTNGEVFVMDDKIQNRWQRYFEGLMNEGAERKEQRQEAAKEQEIVEGVSFGEVEHALRKMKAGKVVGPDLIGSLEDSG